MKELKLKQIHQSESHTYFIVEKQTHRDGEFGEDNYEFTASNEVSLLSISFPEYQSGNEVAEVAVLGDSDKDHKAIIIPNDEVQDVLDAVDEYNEKFGVWKPKDEEEYFWIRGDGSIDKTLNTDQSFDDTLIRYGNYFKTKEEAEIARDKIKAILMEGK